MDESKLIGWLIFVTNTWNDELPAVIPHHIVSKFCEQGWTEAAGEEDWEGRRPLGLTEKGQAMVDLYGPDWGVETLPVESGA